MQTLYSTLVRELVELDARSIVDRVHCVSVLFLLLKSQFVSSQYLILIIFYMYSRLSLSRS